MGRGVSLCYVVAAMLLILACDETKNTFELQVSNSVIVGENALVSCIVTNVIEEVEYNLMSVDETSVNKTDSLPTIEVASFKSTLERTVVIDYGSNCNFDFLGQKKSGKIICAVKGNYLEGNCCFTISFDHFFINDISINGEIEINGKSEKLFNIILENIELTDKDSMVYSISGKMEKEWIEGWETPENPWDDLSWITGEISGITSEQIRFSATFLTPLVTSPACEFILEGSVLLALEKDSLMYEFGDGLCDNIGSYTRDGKIYSFEFGEYDFRYNPQ